MRLIKIGSYLLSLFPLIIILLVQQDKSFFLGNYFLYSVLGTYIILILISLLRLIPKLKLEGIPVDISSIKKRNGEQLAYFMTFIIPFITLDVTKIGELMSLLIIIFFIGIVYIKTNLYFANPMLSLLGFNIYNGTIKNNDNINAEGIILTRKTYKDILNDNSLKGQYIIEDEIIFISK